MIDPVDRLFSELVLVAELAIGEPLSVERIALRLGVSETTVRKLINRCPGGCPRELGFTSTYVGARARGAYEPTRAFLRVMLRDALERIEISARPRAKAVAYDQAT